jgi:hypothetical protein
MVTSQQHQMFRRSATATGPVVGCDGATERARARCIVWVSIHGDEVDGTGLPAGAAVAGLHAAAPAPVALSAQEAVALIALYGDELAAIAESGHEPSLPTGHGSCAAVRATDPRMSRSAPQTTGRAAR